MKILNSFFPKVRYYQNEKRLGFFAARYKRHLKNAASCTELRKFMTSKVVKQIKPIG